MDQRRTILAVTLCLAIWYGWLALRPPPPKGTALEGGGEVAEGQVPKTPEIPLPAAPEPQIEEKVVPFEACGAKGSIGTLGGRLHALTLPSYEGAYHVTPLYQWVAGRVTGKIEGSWQPYGPDPGAELLLSQEARALTVGVGNALVPMEIVSSPSPASVELHGTSPEGVSVTQRFSEHKEGDNCWIAVDVSFESSVVSTVKPYVSIHDHPTGGSSGRSSSYETHRQPMLLVDGSVYYGGALGGGCTGKRTQLSDKLPLIQLEGPVSWFAMADRYFGLYAVVPQGSKGEALLTRIGTGEQALDGVVYRWPDLASGGKQAESYKAYVGANKTPLLSAVDPTLARAVDLGWSAFFGQPLLWLLRLLHQLTNNWGLAIILLTLVVKALFFPMTQRGMKSMQRMQQIQPELAAVKEKYADNPTELNRLTIEIMQKNQVNPVSGCLPTLIQIPVWIALYRVILTSPDLYHTEFLYLRDLSSPDPYLVLPILVMGLMWLQQQLSTPPNMDPVQQQVMKFMPLMIGLFFFAAPSGLAVYMFVNITLSILQQWLIKRSLGGGGGGVPAAAATS